MSNKTAMIMVGPDGVGKTTLLATMYHELSCIKNESSFELAASRDTHHDLQEAYNKLSTITAQPTFTPTGPLLKGTAGIVERQFEIWFNGNKELELVFCDIAGGLIRAEKGHPDMDEFKNKLEESVVIVNVIDGSALVEGDELLFLRKNEPVQIHDLLRSPLINRKNRLILFVITKCEAWLKNEKGRKRLEAAFETQYQIVLKLIEGFENVVAVLIPVKTLGCVEFTRIETKGDEKEIIYVRKPNLLFQPVDTDQPLRYAIAFALAQHNKNRTVWDKLRRWVRNEEFAFQKALSEFAQGHRRKFKIYGNPSLIEVTE